MDWNLALAVGVGVAVGNFVAMIAVMAVQRRINR